MAFDRHSSLAPDSFGLSAGHWIVCIGADLILNRWRRRPSHSSECVASHSRVGGKVLIKSTATLFPSETCCAEAGCDLLIGRRRIEAERSGRRPPSDLANSRSLAHLHRNENFELMKECLHQTLVELARPAAYWPAPQVDATTTCCLCKHIQSPCGCRGGSQDLDGVRRAAAPSRRPLVARVGLVVANSSSETLHHPRRRRRRRRGLSRLSRRETLVGSERGRGEWISWSVSSSSNKLS